MCSINYEETFYNRVQTIYRNTKEIKKKPILEPKGECKIGRRIIFQEKMQYKERRKTRLPDFSEIV